MPGTPGLFNWPVYVGSFVCGWFMIENYSMVRYLKDPTKYKMWDEAPILPKAGDRGVVHASTSEE